MIKSNVIKNKNGMFTIEAVFVVWIVMAFVIVFLIGLSWVYQQARVTGMVHQQLARGQETRIEVEHEMDAGSAGAFKEVISRERSDVNMQWHLFVMRKIYAIYEEVEANE